MRGHPFINTIAILCALLTSQAPEFMQQYFQRLGGVVEELGRIVRQFDEDSTRSGHSRSAALRLMASNSEQLVRDQAARMQENIARYDRLKRQQEAMRDNGSLARFVVFVTTFDQPLATRTFQTYAPALPLTIEGAFFALFGYLISFFVFMVACSPFRRRGVKAAGAT